MLSQTKLLYKLIPAQIVNISLAFYGTRINLTSLGTADYSEPPESGSYRSPPNYLHICTYFYEIVTSLQVFQLKFWGALHISPAYYMQHPSRAYCLGHPNNRSTR
jgi:hypothetical protein